MKNKIILIRNNDISNDSKSTIIGASRALFILLFYGSACGEGGGTRN